MLLIDLVKVKANQSRTSEGTASGSTSLSSSSSSHKRLRGRIQEEVDIDGKLIKNSEKNKIDLSHMLIFYAIHWGCCVQDAFLIINVIQEK